MNVKKLFYYKCYFFLATNIIFLLLCKYLSNSVVTLSYAKRRRGALRISFEKALTVSLPKMVIVNTD